MKLTPTAQNFLRKINLASALVKAALEECPETPETLQELQEIYDKLEKISEKITEVTELRSYTVIGWKDGISRWVCTLSATSLFGAKSQANELFPQYKPLQVVEVE